MHALDFAYMASSASDALFGILQPERLFFLWIGVLVGLTIGLLPGIGGITGFALLVPFTYTMDAYSAFAMLLGMHAVTATSDVIPAVLFGVPGTAASQATVLDGLPMTKKGEAGRALSACYSASILGGLFGALVLGVSVPFVRPLVLSIGTPELLALTIFGIAMVSALSGNAPLRGIVAACFGILVGMVGTDDQTGTIRWADNILYLWDGVPLLPVLLGIFALPELCDLAIQRGALTDKMKYSYTKGMLQGLKDVCKNWFLALRTGSLGAVLGVVPGMTGAVTDWIAYGHALRTEKGATKSFGSGDVRGVIAPESATHAMEGGMLIPTLAFGVPGSAAQAILLSAIMVHGLVPGPAMLSTNLDVTYSMVWSIALANMFGAGVCFLLSGQFAKISMLRYTLVLPLIMSVVFIGAFQGSHSWGDLFTLLLFGVIGWAMKRLRWPRPPLILGLVLGVLIERYMSVSVQRFGAEWLTHPVVFALLAMALVVLMRPLWSEVRHSGLRALLPFSTKPSVRPEDLFYLIFLGLGGWMLVKAMDWPFGASIGPIVVITTMLVACLLSLIHLVFSPRQGDATSQSHGSHRGIHMDLASDNRMGFKTVILRAAIFFGWFLLFLACMALIGLIPTIPVMIVAYMRMEGRESWRLSLIYATTVTVMVYVIFDRVLHVPWPSSYFGSWLPGLAAIIPSM